MSPVKRILYPLLYLFYRRPLPRTGTFQDAVTGNLPRGPNQQQREEHLFQKWSFIIQIN